MIDIDREEQKLKTVAIAEKATVISFDNVQEAYEELVKINENSSKLSSSIDNWIFVFPKGNILFKGESIMSNCKINYPLFGIIYNRKGLKEENYLYTAEEMKEFDKNVYEGALLDTNGISEGAFAANKTYTVFKIADKDSLSDFLNGCWNDDLEPTRNEDWYWENVMDYGLMGEKTDTMRIVIEELYREIKEFIV